MLNWRDSGYVRDSTDDESSDDLIFPSKCKSSGNGTNKPRQSRSGPETSSGDIAYIPSPQLVATKSVSSPISAESLTNVVLARGTGEQDSSLNNNVLNGHLEINNKTTPEYSTQHTSPSIAAFNLEDNQPRVESGGSSPLSNISSQVHSITSSRRRELPQILDAVEPSDDDTQATPIAEGPGRRLRIRTAVQLHPYIVESENLQRRLHNRDHVSVRLLLSQEKHFKTSRNQPRREFVEESALSSQTIEEDGAAPASSVSAASPQATIQLDHESEKIYDMSDDDLPDLATFFAKNDIGRLPKRRKLYHPARSKSPDAESLRISSIARSSVRKTIISSDPPTPPTSQLEPSETITTSTTRFRLPRMLQVEEGSTVQYPAKDHEMETDLEDVPRVDSHMDSPKNVQHDLEMSESSATESEHEFRHARKRIRGVLPASWLRIDKGSVKAAQQNARGSHIDDLGSTTKGVAQRRMVSHLNKSRRFDDFSDSSGDEDSNAQRSDLPFQSETASSTEARVVNNANLPSVAEDLGFEDTIPASRTSGQRRSKDGKGLTNTTHRAVASSRVVRHSKLKAKRSKPSANRLGILDMDSSPTTARPKFISIAHRQSRLQHSYGRQSPGRKLIRLATRGDTEEATGTLNAWQTGRLVPRVQRLPPSRRSGQPALKIPRTDVLPANLSSNPIHPRPNVASHRPRFDQQLLNLDHSPPSSPRTLINMNERPTSTKRIEVKRTKHVQLITSRRNNLRSAQLEREDHRIGPRLTDQSLSLHRYGLSRNNNNMLDAAPHSVDLPLDRFLRDQEVNGTPVQLANEGIASEYVGIRQKRVKKATRPRRLSVEALSFRQPVANRTWDQNTTRPDDNIAVISRLALHVYPGCFSVDFDVRPLQIGTFFHSSTLIGSGDFAAIFTLENRDFDATSGHINIQLDNRIMRWSSWNEETAACVDEIKNLCSEAFEYCQLHPHTDLTGPRETVEYLLRSMIRYCTNCLHFSDSVDRLGFVQKLLSFVEDLLDSISQRLQGETSCSSALQDIVTRTYLLVMNLTICIVSISHDPSVPSLVKQRAQERLQSLCTLIFRQIFENGCAMLAVFYEDLNHHDVRDSGIRENMNAANVLVMLNHTLKWLKCPDFSLDHIVSQAWRTRINNATDTQSFDRIWSDVFLLQPLLDIDINGIYRSAMHKDVDNHCWSIVKDLLTRTFDLYTKSISQTAQMARYIVTCLARCGMLMNRWRWTKSDRILTIIYDFFARRGLSDLPNDRGATFAQFLSHLDENRTLSIEKEDSAFVAFLKLCAMGFRSWTKDTTQSKLQRIASRFMPNHGRTYRKDQNVEQSDLDALRHHHDLLCTLYWALPLGVGPRLEHIQDLVDFSTSHQEACRINIGSWRNLALYIISSPDRQSEINILGEWYHSIITALVNQYGLARSEAEELYEMSKSDQPDNRLSFDVVQMTVTGNQRRILDSLHAALSAMQTVLYRSHNKNDRWCLFDKSRVLECFKVFDATQSRTFASVLQVVNLTKFLLDEDGMNPTQSRDSTARVADSESQDYGDLDVDMFDKLLDYPQPLISDTVRSEIDICQQTVMQLLSNCFGADQMIDDSLLAGVVDVWVILAARSVKYGLRTWQDYLDVHGSESWFQLRSTSQFLSFTPYMLSKVVLVDSENMDGEMWNILGRWLNSLVERVAALKFQHLLTLALLNKYKNEPLLTNLPFARDRITDLYDISLSDLRARRVSLIGCILANIRTSLDAARSDAVELRRDYTIILKQMMNAMRFSYNQLVSGEINTTVADSIATRGSHVAFLQQIVSLLQQYTADICVIDPFFTDSAAFPLPIDDPNYIIGRLRSYAPKLNDDKTKKQLSIFIQTIISRAVVHGDQDTLVDQLSTAILPSPMDSYSSLRKVLFTDILSAYLYVSCNSKSARYMALPLLRSALIVINKMRYHVDLLDHSVTELESQFIDSVLISLSPLLQSLYTNSLFRTNPNEFDIYFLSSIFLLLQQSIIPIEFIIRTSNYCRRSLESLKSIYELSFQPPLHSTPSVAIEERSSAIGQYTRLNLEEELVQNWSWNAQTRKWNIVRRGQRFGEEVNWNKRSSSVENEWKRLREEAKGYKIAFEKLFVKSYMESDWENDVMGGEGLVV